MSQRKGSITPATFIDSTFVPIVPDASHISQEQRAIGNTRLSLSGRQGDLDIAVKRMKVAAEVAIDATKIGQVASGFRAIDTDITSMLDRLAKYEGLVHKYGQFLHFNQGLELCYIVDYKNSTSYVRRFGIDTDLLKGSVGTDLASIFEKTAKGSSASGKSSNKKGAEPLTHLMHPMEVYQAREALNHLDAGNKAAIVDIFERNEDGSIRVGSDGRPEIHSILLSTQIEKGVKQILVIDPSNSEFSQHLMFNKEIICGVDVPIQILVSPTTIKIYSIPNLEKEEKTLPPASINGNQVVCRAALENIYDQDTDHPVITLRVDVVPGPKVAPVGCHPCEYRDCTDIAVKLAFGLNKHAGNIDISKIEELPFVMSITNKKDEPKYPILPQIRVDSDKIFPGIVEKAKAVKLLPPARIRQSSDDFIREKVQKLLSSIERQQDCLESYGAGALKKEIAVKLTEFFVIGCTFADYTKHLRTLQELHEDNIKEIVKIMGDAVGVAQYAEV